MSHDPWHYDDPEDFAQFLTEYFNNRLPLGEVSLFHYDLGIVETMEAVRITGPNNTVQFFLTDVPGVALAPGLPGIPVVFEISDDLYRAHKLPSVVVRRTGMPYDLARLHPGQRQYRAPSPAAVSFEVNGRTGYSAYEERQQAMPHTIEYTIAILTRNRGGGAMGSAVNEAQRILQYLWRFFQPYCTVYVRDSTSEPEDSKREMRQYDAFVEDVGTESQVLEVTGRIIGFQLRLRVEGEIDINPAYTVPAVTGQPQINTDIKDDGS